MWYFWLHLHCLLLVNAFVYMSNVWETTKNVPTVRPSPNFDAEKDAETLKEAMRGWGCENQDIIDVLSKRSSNQRELIEEAYKNLYGKDLLDDLKSELGGNFERLVVALLLPWPQLGAKAINKACKGAGTNEQTLIDVLCTANNCQIKTIAEAYREMFDDGLENVFERELTGDFQNLMIAVCQGARHEDDAPDAGRAKEDAQKILEAGELKYGTDESTFTAVLVRNSYAQLRQVSQAYQQIADKSLEEVCDSELSGDLLKAAKTILAVARSSDGYWATRLHDSMAGLGTDDKALMNIIVARSEIDLGNIKKEFEKVYEQSLESWVESECSGDYKKLLIALIAG